MIYSVTFSKDGTYLALSSCSDIVLLKHFSCSKYSNSYCLVWQIGTTSLLVRGLNLRCAQGISANNYRLLTQLGAVEVELLSAKSKEKETKELIAKQEKPEESKNNILSDKAATSTLTTSYYTNVKQNYPTFYKPTPDSKVKKDKDNKGDKQEKDKCRLM